MKYTIEIEINQEEHQIKVHGITEPTSFLTMCFSQSLMIMEQDMAQIKKLKGQMKKCPPGLLKSEKELIKAAYLLRKITERHEEPMWDINDRLESGETLEDIMNPKKEPVVAPEMKIVPPDTEV